jgi:hypothetical protein
MLRRFRSGLVAFPFLASSTITAAQAPGLPVTIAWDANSEPSVIGYRVYIGTAPSIYTETVDAGSATSFTYRNGAAGLRYYFAVAAYADGNKRSRLFSRRAWLRRDAEDAAGRVRFDRR